VGELFGGTLTHCCLLDRYRVRRTCTVPAPYVRMPLLTMVNMAKSS